MSGADDVVALDGRSLGKRGTRTRRHLLDATAALLQTHGVRDLRVIEIARVVGTSPATFYQYFRDVEDAVLVLAEEAGAEVLELTGLLDADWDGPDGLAAVRALVEGFIAVWGRHDAVLRTRNLAAQEGDARFEDVRRRTLSPFTDRFVTLVRQNQKAGRVAPEVSPGAAAVALVALVESVASYQREIDRVGIRRDDLVETTARIVHQTLTGGG